MKSTSSACCISIDFLKELLELAKDLDATEQGPILTIKKKERSVNGEIFFQKNK